MPTLRRLGWTLAAATLLILSATPVGPLPPIGPFLDPVAGVWSVAHQTRPAIGVLPLAPLSAPVTVVTDRRGVPHLFASTDLDAWRALGRIHVRDRLFQLELQSRATEGTLTEWVGIPAIRLDREMRQLGLARRADSLWSTLDSSSLAYRALSAYAEGVNSGIAALGPRDLPFEYHLLNVRPRSWHPKYTLYLAFRMAYTLAWQNNDLEREALATVVGDAAAADLLPAESPIQVPVVPGRAGAAPLLPFELAPPRPGERPRRAPVNLASAAADQDLLVGSNNWVVGPRRTAGHQALLAGDPHLELTLPSIWYEAHLVSADGMDVYGVTIPGEPAVLIGLTRGVAWSFTNSEADFVDHYREVVDDDQVPTRHHVDGQWYPVTSRLERYRDRRGTLIATDTIYTTRRGPLVPYAGRWRSIRWTALEMRDPIGAFLDLQRAGSVREWLAAVGRLESPSQNGVAADTAGHIAERTGGRYPRRPGNDGARIFDGTSSGEDWQGDLPALAGIVDPPRGFLFSANQQIVDPRVDPSYRGAGWAAPWRALRIQRLLAADSAVTLEAMRRWQTDPVSERAEWWRPALVAASAGREALAAPAALLAGWRDGYRPASRGAALFEATMDAVATLTWDELAAGDGRRVATPSAAVLAALRDHPDDIWWDRRATPERESRDDILRLAIARAWRQLADPGELGTDTTTWRWDRYRSARIPHLAFLPGLGVAKLAVTGGNGTLSPLGAGGSHGASWRMVVEMGPAPRVLATYPGGQSGNPASARYDDRVEGWRTGLLDTVRLPRTPDELAAGEPSERFRFVPGQEAPRHRWPSTWWLVAAAGVAWGVVASRTRRSAWWGAALGAGVWGALLLATWEPAASWRLATRLAALMGGGPAIGPVLLTLGWAAVVAGVVGRAVESVVGGRSPPAGR
ncbi:MAG TPA: penicillin acylase family protein [Gemmatimonadales bacterium]|nr:penicillin acylase family protein [Gemmatimonadales bacterium]